MAARNRSRRRWWAVAAASAAVASFVAARLLLPRADATLLAELPVIRQMNQLAEVNDIEFLRQLSREVPFDDLVADEAAVQRDLEQIAAAGVASAERRREWIEKLTGDQKANLAAQLKDYAGLPENERGRLKALQQKIAAASDREELRKTLSAYGQWLARQSSAKQSELRSMAANERIREIRETIKWEGRQAAQRLSEADAKEFRQEIFEIYEAHKEEFAKAMRHRGRGGGEGRHPRRRGKPLEEKERALIVAQWAIWNRDTDDRTRKRIVTELSADAKQHLDDLARRGGEPRVKRQLWHWMHDAMKPQREPGDLERFFAKELDEAQRERLLSLPNDQMEAELEQMYLGSRFGLDGVEWLGGKRGQ